MYMGYSGWYIFGMFMLTFIFVIYVMFSYISFMCLYTIRNKWLKRIASMISALLVSYAICLGFKYIGTFLFDLIDSLI